MTTIKAMVRAAILTGAVGFLPTAALADDTRPSHSEVSGTVPDHAEAEARSASGTMIHSTLRTTPGIPDHAQAEARSMEDTTDSSIRASSIVPDHQTAEEPTAASPDQE